MSVFRIATAALAALLPALAQPALADDCARVWEDAKSVMAAECNDRIDDNSMCFAHAPLRTSPVFADFSAPGNRREVAGLNWIRAEEGSGVGGFSLLKIVTEDELADIPFGQTITLVAFGHTQVEDIESDGRPVDLGAATVCDLRLNPGSTQYGGSFIRAIPDPRFRVACVREPCEDKNNLLHLVREGETVGVIGRNAARDAVLVTNRHAAGWMTGLDEFVSLQGCSMSDLREFPDDYVLDSLARTQRLPVATRFRLVNADTPESRGCMDGGRPHGGLLVLNNAHQNALMTINSLSVVFASSLYIAGNAEGLFVFVLQGEATVTNQSRQSVTARSGEVILAQTQPGVPPTKTLPSGSVRLNYCDALSGLARAALQVAGADRTPEERYDYCRFAPPGGYSLTPDLDALQK